MKKNIFYAAILLLTGAMIAACSGSDDLTDNTTPEPQTPTGKGDVVLKGTLGSKGDQTRTIAADGTGSWEVGDKFAIYYTTEDGHSTAVATVNSINSNGSANFTATLSYPKTGNNDVTLVYPASAHNGQGGFKTDALMKQEGTLDYINTKGLDIETASTTMNVEEKTATLNSDVTLQPQVCIYKMDLREGPENLDVTKLEISDGAHNYTIIPTVSTNIFTIALLPVSNANFTFTATTTEETQFYTMQNGVTLANCTIANIGHVFDKDGNIYEVSTGTGAIYSKKSNNRSLSAGRFYDQILQLSQSENNNPGVAVIAYVGNQGSVDNSNEDTQKFRGLAVALNYVNGNSFDSEYSWCNKTSGTSTSCSNEYSNDIAVARQWKNGIGRTADLINEPDGHTHTAAMKAHNYGTSHPAGTSDWFLASLGQWQLIFQGLATKAGNMTELCTEPMLLFKYPDNYILSNENVGPVMGNAGAMGFYNCIWTSSEYSNGNAWALAYDLSATNELSKTYKSGIRPVIAF